MLLQSFKVHDFQKALLHRYTTTCSIIIIIILQSNNSQGQVELALYIPSDIYRQLTFQLEVKLRDQVSRQIFYSFCGIFSIIIFLDIVYMIGSQS